MEIKITKAKETGEDIIVSFTTEYGDGVALWAGYKKPDVGKTCNVELDITDELVWGKDVRKSSSKAFAIKTAEDAVILTGILEKAYADGIVDMRIGNSILQLELEGKKLPLGEFVELRTDILEIYETEA